MAFLWVPIGFTRYLEILESFKKVCETFKEYQGFQCDSGRFWGFIKHFRDFMESCFGEVFGDKLQ